ncbi:uncharacterized protein J3R85_012462 [Psidium guajava]|nr:uncharacterized protein J3R85_012462 [Psidium guajava]
MCVLGGGGVVALPFFFFLFQFLGPFLCLELITNPNSKDGGNRSCFSFITFQDLRAIDGCQRNVLHQKPLWEEKARRRRIERRRRRKRKEEGRGA